MVNQIVTTSSEIPWLTSRFNNKCFSGSWSRRVLLKKFSKPSAIRTDRNKMPVNKMTIKDLARFNKLKVIPTFAFILIFHNWFRESLITLKSVVDTKIRKRNPPAVKYQVLDKWCTLISVLCSSDAVLFPTISARFFKSCRVIIRGLMIRPKTWIRMISTAGRAKVVKKAVAPAIRNGSFSLNSRKLSRKRLRIFIRCKSFIQYACEYCACRMKQFLIWNKVITTRPARV